MSVYIKNTIYNSIYNWIYMHICGYIWGRCMHMCIYGYMYIIWPYIDVYKETCEYTYVCAYVHECMSASIFIDICI